MKLAGTYTFEAPRDVVWQALLDPTILAKVMPGCERLDQIGENEYKGTLKIKVGPVQGQFEGVVNLSDLNAPESYRMQVDGKGAPGFMKGVGEVRLEEQNGSTVMHYTGEAQVGGRIASVGQRLLDSSAKALTKQSLEGLHAQIRALVQPNVTPPAEFALIDEQPLQPQPPQQPQPFPSSQAVDVAAPSQTKFALGVAHHLIDDLVPPPQRPKLIAAGVIFVTSLFVLDWWITRIARKVANELLERRRG